MAISSRTRFLVLKRDGFRCVYCGRQAGAVELHVDHIQAKANGGADDIENYASSCRDCNLGKGCIEILSSDEIDGRLNGRAVAIYTDKDGPLLIGVIKAAKGAGLLLHASFEPGTSEWVEINFYDDVEAATTDLEARVKEQAGKAA